MGGTPRAAWLASVSTYSLGFTRCSASQLALTAPSISGELVLGPVLDAFLDAYPTVSARLLLLVNYRPEYEHAWHRKTYYQQLRLDPLPPASAG